MSGVKKSPLGRGIDSLIPRAAPQVQTDDRQDGRLIEADITEIKPNDQQPRHDFDPEALAALSTSVKERGIMQPLVVSRTNGGFMLISGERRLRAAGMAGLKKVPVVIIPQPDENNRLELALIENTQRDDLKPLELAKAYKELTERCSYIQEDIARIAGKSRSAVANTMRLLDLFPFVMEALEKKIITEGHARVFLTIDEGQARRLLNAVINRKLSVRQTEAMAREMARPVRSIDADPDQDAFAKELGDYFGLKVDVKNRGKRGGVIEIRYRSADELDTIVNKIRGKS